MKRLSASIKKEMTPSPKKMNHPREDSDFVAPDDSIGKFYEEKVKDRTIALKEYANPTTKDRSITNDTDSKGDEDQPDDEKEEDRKRQEEGGGTDNKVVVNNNYNKGGNVQSKEEIGGMEEIDLEMNTETKDDKEKKKKEAHEESQEVTEAGVKENREESNEGTDEDYIHIDEETFRAWQTAYAEAEQGAMEEQAKASTNCCVICFQLLIIVLIVAKLEKNYGNENPNDVGFNTFWILFPFLLFFGLICCICTCLIYGASPIPDTEEDGQGMDPQEETDEENPTPPPPPPPPATAAKPAPLDEKIILPPEPEPMAAEKMDDPTVDSVAETNNTSIPLPYSESNVSEAVSGQSIPLPYTDSVAVSEENTGSNIEDLD